MLLYTVPETPVVTVPSNSPLELASQPLIELQVIPFIGAMTINDIWLVAVSSEDYVAVSNFTLVFDRCQMKSCVNLTIVNDDVLEMVESFTVSLGNSNPSNSIQTEDRFAHLASRISIDPETAEIHIIDSDGKGLYIRVY